jgi:hypothetical protein
MQKLSIIPIFKQIGNSGIEHMGNISFKSQDETLTLEVWLNAKGLVVYQIAERYEVSTLDYQKIQNRYVYFRNISEVEILRGLFR